MIKPPLPENKFLPHQTSGYRISPLISDILSIERGSRIIDVSKKEILLSGDILNIAGMIRIQFFLQKRMISETVKFDQSEKIYLANARGSSQIKRINRQSFGVFFKLLWGAA